MRNSLHKRFFAFFLILAFILPEFFVFNTANAQTTSKISDQGKPFQSTTIKGQRVKAIREDYQAKLKAITPTSGEIPNKELEMQTLRADTFADLKNAGLTDDQANIAADEIAENTTTESTKETNFEVSANTGALDSCFEEVTGIGLKRMISDLSNGLKGAISSAIMTGTTLVPGTEPFRVPTSNASLETTAAVSASSASAMSFKENCLDKIATAIAKTMLHSLTDSIVAWADSGFDGNPAFIQNPEKFFKGVGNQIAGEMIENSALGFLCSPFSLNINLSLARRQRGSRPVSCTLDDVINNVENFAKFTEEDFNAGGWSAWNSMVTNPNNNPYGAKIIAGISLDMAQNDAIASEQMQLGWGNGFFSMKDSKGNISTPGQTIQNSLEQSLGSGMRELELADEIDEVIDAITTALMRKAITGIAGS